MVDWAESFREKLEKWKLVQIEGSIQKSVVPYLRFYEICKEKELM